MIIKQAHIDRFGILAEQTLAPLTDGMNLFLGRNEAGKSTMMQFFRAMLFGYKRGNRTLDPIPRAKKTGLSGGTLLLQAKKNDIITLTRRPGEKKGGLALFSETGVSISDAYLDELLGRITVDVFDNVFAFNLKSLMEFSSLNGENVRHALHGAAFGLGMRSPLTVIRELDKRASDLLKMDKAGVRALINLTIAELEEIDEQLASNAPDIERYGLLQEELACVEKEAGSVTDTRVKLTKQKRSIEKRIALWGRFEELRSVQSKLLPGDGLQSQCKANQFAPDALHRLEMLVEKEATYLLSLAEAKESCRQNEKALIEARRALVEILPSKRPSTLREQKEARLADAQSLPAIAQKIEHLFGLQEKGFIRLGVNWSLEKVLQADTSLAVKDFLSQMKVQLERKEADVLRLRDQADRLFEEYQAALLAVEQMSSKEKNTISTVPDTVEYESLLFLHGRASAIFYEIPSLRAEFEQKSFHSNEKISDVDAEWTEKEIIKANTGIRAKSELSELAKQALAGKAALERVETLVQQKEITLASLEQKVVSLHLSEDEEALLETPLAEYTKNLQTLDTLVREYQAASSRESELAEYIQDFSKPSIVYNTDGFFYHSKTQLFLALSGLAVGILFLVISLFAERASLFLGGGVSFLLLGSLFAWKNRRLLFSFSQQAESSTVQFYSAQFAKAKNEREALLTRLKAEVQLLVPIFSFLATSTEFLPEALTQAFLQVEGEKKKQVQAIIKKEVYLEQERLLGIEKEALFFIKKEKTQAEQRCHGNYTAWNAFLSSFSFPWHTSPEVADTVYERILAAKALIKEKEQAEMALNSAYENVFKCVVEVSRHSFFKLFLEKQGTLQLLEEILFSIDAHTADIKVLDVGSEKTGKSSLRFTPQTSIERILRDFGLAFNALRDVYKAQQEQVTRHKLLQEREENAQQLKNRYESASSQLNGAEKALEDLSINWEDWLQEYGFLHKISIQTAFEAVALLTEMQERDKHLQTAYAERAHKEKSIFFFVRDILRYAKHYEFTLLAQFEGIFTACSSEAIRAGDIELAVKQLPLALGLLNELCFFEEQMGLQKTQARMLTDRQEELLSTLKNAEFATIQVQNSIKEMLLHAQASDLEAFRIQFANWEEQTKLKQHEKELISYFQVLAQEERVSLEELLNVFNTECLEELEEKLLTAQEKLFTAESEQTRLAERKGSLLQAQKNLSAGKGNAPLWKKKAYLEDQLAKFVHEWQVYALAKHMLLNAKSLFEREGQTGVIGTASEIFSRITEREYRGISANIADGAFHAQHSSGELRNPEKNLSQGTKEQLFLAVRLAYIRNHALHSEAIPVLMDDVLVNFDRKRAQKTAQELIRFSQQNQILFFTCHEATVDMFYAAYEKEKEDGNGSSLALFHADKGRFSLQS